MTTRYADNAGAKMKRSIHSYFSAQTAYHDAHRGRGKGKIGNNTYIVTNVDGGGGYSIVLHRTPIVTYHPDGRITLRSGGFQTVTTKARMNEVLPGDIRVYQERHDWFVNTPYGTIPFYDGMVIETGATTSHSGGPHEVNPRANPGKFDSDLDRYMYKLSMDGTDEDISFADNWYGRMNGVTFLDVIRAAEDEGEDEHSAQKAWRKELGTGWRGDTINTVILHEDSYGFLSVRYYRSDRDADKYWEEIVRESEEYGDEDSPP
jgi:hypothetical protein